MKTLFEQAETFTIERWTVVLYEGKWLAADPIVKCIWWYPESRENSFKTFAEAIEYAQKQARA